MAQRHRRTRGKIAGKPEFVAKFRHWRSGKIIWAKNYGKRGFPIGKKK